VCSSDLRLEQAQQRLNIGDLVTICPEQAHGFKACSAEGFRYLNVAFSAETLQRFRNTYFEPGDRLWLPGSEPYRHHLTPDKIRLLQALIHELSNAPRSQFAIDRFLLNLINELRHPTVGDITLAEMPAWLRHACDKALDPTSTVISVAQLVQESCRSHEHVSRTLQRCTGCTPTEFLNEVRVRRAAHLLSMTDRSISRIALECHFSSLAHFHRLFRIKFRMTPRQYRIVGREATVRPA